MFNFTLITTCSSLVRLIYKSILLCSLVLLVASIIKYSLILPYHWGNNQVHAKLNHIAEKDIDPDIYFLGSSVTNRQIMPNVFDSLLHHRHHSYNLGSDGTLPPQSLYLFESLIKQDSSISTVFIELNNLDHFGRNLLRTKKKYYLHPGHLWTFAKYVIGTDISLFHKLGIFGLYGYSYLENILWIGMRTDLLKYYSNPSAISYSLIGENEDGHIPMPGEKTKSKEMLDRLPEYMRRISEDYKKAINDLKTNDFSYNKQSKIYFEKYIKLAQQHGIHLIYILNPIEFAFEDAEHMVGLMQMLPSKNKIDLANPYLYPEFWALENRWDEGHLNEKGSLLFTIALAQKFQEL